MRATEMGIEDSVLSALRNQRARDVRRPCHRAAAGAPRGADLGAGADAAGRAGPPHHRRTAAAAGTHVRVAGPSVEIRGTCVLVDGAVKSLSPAGMATIRALAHRPGTVVSRGDLLAALPGSGTDTHAVETAVLRLRTALGDKNIVVDGGQAGLPARGRRGAHAMSSAAGGARHPQTGGVSMIGELAERCRRYAGPQVHVAFVDVLGPTPSECSAPLAAPDGLVPAFLSSGYHVRHDIPAHVTASGHPDVTVTHALGPARRWSGCSPSGCSNQVGAPMIR